MDPAEAQQHIVDILRLDASPPSDGSAWEIVDSEDNTFEIEAKSDALLLWASIRDVSRHEPDVRSLSTTLSHAFKHRHSFQAQLVYRPPKSALGVFCALYLTQMDEMRLRAGLLDFHRALRHWKCYFSSDHSGIPSPSIAYFTP